MWLRVLHKARSKLAAEMDWRIVRRLYRKGLVYLDVPIRESDHVVGERRHRGHARAGGARALTLASISVPGGEAGGARRCGVGRARPQCRRWKDS